MGPSTGSASLTNDQLMNMKMSTLYSQHILNKLHMEGNYTDTYTHKHNLTVDFILNEEKPYVFPLK